MSTSVKSEIMKSAWRMFRNLQSSSFSRCLKMAWEIQKELESELPQIKLRKTVNRILNRLSINTHTEKITAKGTQSWWRLVKSKKLKRCSDEEVKALVSEGILFNNDLYNEEKRNSAVWLFSAPKKKEKRMRIAFKNPIRVDIDKFLAAA